MVKGEIGGAASQVFRNNTCVWVCPKWRPMSYIWNRVPFGRHILRSWGQFYYNCGQFRTYTVIPSRCFSVPFFFFFNFVYFCNWNRIDPNPDTLYALRVFVFKSCCCAPCSRSPCWFIVSPSFQFLLIILAIFAAEVTALVYGFIYQSKVSEFHICLLGYNEIIHYVFNLCRCITCVVAYQCNIWIDIDLVLYTSIFTDKRELGAVNECCVHEVWWWKLWHPGCGLLAVSGQYHAISERAGAY